tara:strand:- start:16697 stop:18091 length:1395 start_codon:yes stop_codon:yes gene_type:complete
MKIYFKHLIVLIIFGCDSLIPEDLNINPNSPSEAPEDLVLTGSMVGTILFHEGATSRRAGIWSGYFRGTDRQHEGFDNYLVEASDFTAIWNDVFINSLRNAIIVEEKALSSDRSGVMTGISKVIQAHGLGVAASLYGDIPFDQAGRIEYIYPEFESQDVVYEKVQDLLTQAILELSLDVNKPSNGSDIFFNGDSYKWIKVANSLKARFYMHTKNYDQAYNYASLGIGSPAENMMAIHGDVQGNSNLFYQFFTGSRGTELTSENSKIVEIISSGHSSYRGNSKTNEKARFDFYFSGAGRPNYTSGYFSRSNTFPLVSYSENTLTLAESGLRSKNFYTGLSHLNEFRGYMSGGGYLNNGYDTLEMNYNPYIQTDFESGGIENNDNISKEDALLREILEERYVTFYGQIEGFNDVRRTRKETYGIKITPNTGVSLPERFLYPQSEIDANPNTPSPIPGFFEPTKINK